MFRHLAKNKRIYADTAAATPLDRLVRQVMDETNRLAFGNPSSLHEEGVAAKKHLTAARVEIAKVLNAHPDEIIFTSGGTEGNNLALRGVVIVAKQKIKRPHIIVSAIEHSSVLKTAKDLAAAGARLTILPVDQDGVIKLEALRRALNKDTVLVSIIYASNEIGTIEPLAEVAKIIRRARKATGRPYPYFHTDACQAPRFLPLATARLGVDLLTLNGSKIYGPRGCGVLFAGRGVELVPQLIGGGQENNRRSGTEVVAAAAGLAAALTICVNERQRESARLGKLRDDCWREIKRQLPTVVLNGHPANRLPHHLSLSWPGVAAEDLVLTLDALGLAISAGSACASEKNEEPYAIMALGQGRERADSAIRLTFDRRFTKRQADQVINLIILAVKKLCTNLII